MNEFFNNVSLLFIQYSAPMIFFGYLCCAIGIGLYSFKSQSWLLKLSAAGFFVCAFAMGASIAYPLTMNIDPTVGAIFTSGSRPEWVQLLGSAGIPIALVVSGLSLLTFSLRNSPRHDI